MAQRTSSNTKQIVLWGAMAVLGVALATVVRLNSPSAASQGDSFNIQGGFYSDLAEVIGLLVALLGITSLVRIYLGAGKKKG